MTEEESCARRCTKRVGAAMGERSKGDAGILKELLFLLIKIVVIIAVIVAIFTFMFGIYRSADISMYPSVKDGDLVIFYPHGQGIRQVGCSGAGI